ncbi:MAG: LptA/OstA family protein [Alphaproteobacteria bacterium]
MLKFFTILFLLILPPFALAEDIELTADNGLEWNQKEQKIIMRENANAKTPEYELKADYIEAFYKEPNKKIYQVIATDNVKVISKEENITTDKLTYDINNEIIKLFSTSNPTTLKNKDSEIIAKDDIIYYKAKNYATAKNAKIINTGRTLFADDIKVEFERTKASSNQLKKILANGNIKLIDGEEELYGDTAEYNPKTGFATISGNVYFKKGTQANLSGGKIIYDMKTGIARVLPKDGESKVKGVFSTDKK